MRNRRTSLGVGGRWLVAAWGICAALASHARGDEPPTGEEIYLTRCATCHGAQGEGTAENYPWPLAGELTTEQLAELIARTMPADDPDECVGEEAQRVAAYIGGAFYSARTAERERPRIALSRLTVRQYRATIADLLAQLAEPPANRAGPSGLQGQYFTRDRTRGGELALERIDGEIDFRYGESSPEPEKIQPREFAIYWQGAVWAPETGEYEFVVESENSVRLWVNDPRTPVIDAWIKSGTETTYRASVWLLAGRAYPLRLDFAKGAQGVEQSEEQKAKAGVGTASIRLAWRRPSGVMGTIGERHLMFAESPATLVVQSPFPPDDRSLGYERGTAISKAWEQATTEAAIEVADYVTARLPAIVGHEEITPDDEPRLREYCTSLAALAFRRPLNDEQRALYIDRTFAGADDLPTAVQRAVLKILKSPRFLYHEVGGDDAWTVAERLSYVLWDSIPDAELARAAESGELNAREQVIEQARRMVHDARATAKLREFLLQWMKIDPPPRLRKDLAVFPGFDDRAASDLRESLELLLADVLASNPADFRRLLLADQVYVNGRLAGLYGLELPAEAPFQAVTLDGGGRAGVLTHPYLLSVLADAQESSPIRRGVFVARSVLGRQLRPPPDAFEPLPAELHPGLSTRERVELQTAAQECRTCHALINPLGYALEHFDAAGRFRELDRGRPVDSRGSYVSRTGKQVELDGARALAEFVAASDETHLALVEKLFQYAVNQPIRALGWEASARLRESFVAEGFNLRELMVQIGAMFGWRSPAQDVGAEARVSAALDGK